MLSSVGVIERSFKRKLFIFHRLDVTRDGMIPVKNPFVFVTKPVNFLNMSLPNQRFVIVSDCRFGSRDIVRVKSSHQ
mgnify:CR=1 FL=1